MKTHTQRLYEKLGRVGPGRGRRGGACAGACWSRRPAVRRGKVRPSVRRYARRGRFGAARGVMLDRDRIECPVVDSRISGGRCAMSPDVDGRRRASRPPDDGAPGPACSPTPMRANRRHPASGARSTPPTTADARAGSAPLDARGAADAGCAAAEPDAASVPDAVGDPRVRARLTRRMSGQRTGAAAEPHRARAAVRGAPRRCTRRPTSSWCSAPTRSPRRRTAASSAVRRSVHHPPAGGRHDPGRPGHGHHHAGRRAAARHRRGHPVHAEGR